MQLNYFILQFVSVLHLYPLNYDLLALCAVLASQHNPTN